MVEPILVAGPALPGAAVVPGAVMVADALDTLPEMHNLYLAHAAIRKEGV